MSSYRYSSDANSDIEEIALYIFNLNPVSPLIAFLTPLKQRAKCSRSIHLSGGHARNLGRACVHFPLGTI
jgi:plasmid stabilization system protein ParE